MGDWRNVILFFVNWIQSFVLKEAIMKFVAGILLFGLSLSAINCYAQNSDEILSRLKAELDPSKRRNLILQLADRTETDLPENTRGPVVNLLLNWYWNDSDAGVHSAIDYVLRHGMKGDIPRNVNWNRSDTLGKIDQALMGKKSVKQNWYVTPAGLTMTIIPSDAQFTMGSPITEEGRDADETIHTIKIPRSFAVSTKEITVEQFQEFLDANPTVKAMAKSDPAKDPSKLGVKLNAFSSFDDCPQILMTWYEAAQYCNWLSAREGIPQNEWCYPSIDQIRSGMKLPENYLTRMGYRLLTEAEWEYVARAGSNGTQYFKQGQLHDYAWYSKSPPKKKSDPIAETDPHHTWPVGQLIPNQFGLFDVYGNVWEWCQSTRKPYQQNENKLPVIDTEESNRVISDTVAMVRRGGSFSYGKEVMRSAHRGATNYFPMQRRDNVGFRIARTIR